MAISLINAMEKMFEPELYKDEYQQKLREIIEKKIAGQDTSAPAESRPANVIDIMDALKKSLERAKAVSQ